MFIEFGKIGLQLALQGQGAGEVIRGEYVALHLAKDNLDLIQPTGVLGQPVQAHLKGQLQRCEPRPQLLRGVSGAVVQNQMEDFHARTQRTLKEGQQEGFKIDKLLTQAGLGKGQAALATSKAQKSCTAPIRL